MRRIPNRVAEFRRERGLTQEQLAGMIGADKGFISRVENGKVIEIPTAQRIAAALGTDISTLWPTKKSR